MKRGGSEILIGSRKLILFVHGLGGNSIDSWRHFTALIVGDNLLKDYVVDSYSYETSLFLGIPFLKRQANIEELARGLSTYIKHHHSDKDFVVIVAHSMGGLVSKKFLIEEKKAGRTISKIRGLLLYAVPHNGSALASKLNPLSWVQHQVAQLAPHSAALDAICNDWEILKIEDAVTTIYVVGNLDRVVKPPSARAYPGNRKAETHPTKDHSSIIRPSHRDDTSYKILQRFILSLAAQEPTLANQSEAYTGAVKDITQQPRIEDSVLFYKYSRDVEDWYLKRNLDIQLSAVASAMSVWAFGESGVGKTAALRRFLDMNNHKSIYISLSTLRNEPIENFLCRIHDDIQSVTDPYSALVRHSDRRQIIDNTAKLLCKAIDKNGIYVFIEEIPISEVGSFRYFFEAISSLMIQVTSLEGSASVRFLISSIVDPSDFVSGEISKVRERLKIIRCDRWEEDDLKDLILIIIKPLKIVLSDEEISQLVKYANGSPRFVKHVLKSVFRKFSPGKSIDQVCATAKAEGY